MNLAEARAAAGYRSQQALAVASGLSIRTVQHIEAGTKRPGIDTAAKLAQALHLSLDAFYRLLPEAA